MTYTMGKGLDASTGYASADPYQINTRVAELGNESLHETFLKQGFLVIPNAVPSELCRQARDRAWHLAETLVPPDDALPFTTAPDTGARDQYFLKSARTVRLLTNHRRRGIQKGTADPIRSAMHFMIVTHF